MEDEYIRFGKIVNTHGIKGELRILSDFKYKDRVFVQNRRIYIGEDKEEHVITSYRHHKIFDMIKLAGYDDINEVLRFKNKDVFVKKNDLNLGDKEYLDEDLINLNVVFNDKEVGYVVAIRQINPKNKIIEAKINDKMIMIPYHDNFIKDVDLDNKKIVLDLIEGMI